MARCAPPAPRPHRELQHEPAFQENRIRPDPAGRSRCAEPNFAPDRSVSTGAAPRPQHPGRRTSPAGRARKSRTGRSLAQAPGVAGRQRHRHQQPRLFQPARPGVVPGVARFLGPRGRGGGQGAAAALQRVLQRQQATADQPDGGGRNPLDGSRARPDQTGGGKLPGGLVCAGHLARDPRRRNHVG